MTSIEPHNQPNCDASSEDHTISVGDAHASSFKSVLFAWTVAVFVLLVALAVVQPQRLFGSAVIAFCSGLVTVLSMAPGLAMWFSDTASELPKSETEAHHKQFRDFVVASSFGMLFRIVGTVALFLFCRYQLAEPAGWAAAMTLTWYLLLTTVEIVTLCRSHSPVDSRPNSKSVLDPRLML